MNRKIIKQFIVSLMYRECSPGLGKVKYKGPRRPSAHFKYNNSSEYTILYYHDNIKHIYEKGCKDQFYLHWASKHLSVSS